MESKMTVCEFLRVACLLLTLLASGGQTKSIPSSSGICMSPISTASLYPATNTLALHAMQALPFQDDSVPAPSACPGTVSASDPLNRRSTCPFEYVTNYEPDRIPASIQEARCLCDGCLDAYTGQQSPDLTCQPIRYAMKVMKKSTTTPINGFEMYSMTTQQITVGCACSRAVS